MTFLELVQRTCSESGVIPNPPASVTGTQGMLARVVAWVNSAWSDIQLSEPGWLWMRQEAYCPVFSGQSKFTYSELGLTRFNGWITHEDGRPLWTLYEAKADESELCFIDYSEALLWGRGVPVSGRPSAYSIDPAIRVVFNTVPDKAYSLGLVYRLSPQALTADLDVPEMPAEYHEVIVYKALLKAAIFDEGFNQVSYWQGEMNRLMANLRWNQLPRIRLGGPLA